MTGVQTCALPIYKLSGIYDTAGVFALVILVTSIALLIIYLVDLLERRVLLKWKYV